MYESGCQSPLSSSKISISQSKPWVITVSEVDTKYNWELDVCLKCMKGDKVKTLDPLKFIKNGICGWMRVRFIPGGWGNFVDAWDQL